MPCNPATVPAAVRRLRSCAATPMPLRGASGRVATGRAHRGAGKAGAVEVPSQNTCHHLQRDARENRRVWPNGACAVSEPIAVSGIRGRNGATLASLFRAWAMGRYACICRHFAKSSALKTALDPTGSNSRIAVQCRRAHRRHLLGAMQLFEFETIKKPSD